MTHPDTRRLVACIWGNQVAVEAGIHCLGGIEHVVKARADITVAQLLQLVRRLPERARRMPISAERNLKQQWLGWLAEYSGPGYYGRRTFSPLARSVYVHLHSLPMLSWLALHLGVRAAVVRDAVRQGERLDTAAGQGAAFRRAVGWADIEPLLRLAIGPRIKSPHDLRRRISTLSARCPETDRFRRQWDELPGQHEQSVVWYEHQKEHWLRWLAEYDGPGAYGRVVRSRSAEYAYNHVVNPQMLVWLAEAVGIPKVVVRNAVKQALAQTSMSAMSKAIRRVIDWKQIAARLA